MTYSKFIYEVEQTVINQLDNGIWYLEPEWKSMVRQDIVQDITEVKDCYLDDWWDLEEVLKLEVERRNARDSKKNEVINWLYDLITAQVEPAMLQEETDYIKQVVDFMKTNHASQEK